MDTHKVPDEVWQAARKKHSDAIAKAEADYVAAIAAADAELDAIWALEK